jgi:hypothetical protein
MRRYSLNAGRTCLLVALACVVSLVAASGAQAVVVNTAGAGQFGVALVPGSPLPASSTTASPCDPWLAPDLSFPALSSPLCSHGGAVMHGNETFALTWDPNRSYFATTRNYVQQFLRDVADGSGTLTSPYAVTSQYKDGPNPGDRAANASVYGGGCTDFGVLGGATCSLGNTTGTGAGHGYPPSQCTPSGSSYNFPSNTTNNTCLTNAQLQAELVTMAIQTGLSGRIKPGHAPLLVLLTPPGVEVCLDNTSAYCSANSAATNQFCSYHSHIQVGGTDYAYVVQPWTVHTGCDEPGLPALQPDPTAQQLSADAGSRLVSPLSQGQIAAIVNPDLSGWFALDGSEINDNGGCVPLPRQLDQVAVGTGAYFLQREFNNAGVLEADPNAPTCTPSVLMAPTFIVPSAVNQGDVVQFDGSTTVSSLIVPRDNYRWDFGDGTSAIGPSVVHTYASGGTYTVTMRVTDRGGNTAGLSQTITVLGPAGQPVTTPPIIPGAPGTTPATIPKPGSGQNSGLHVRIQLLPQGLRAMLRYGVSVRVTSNQRADGFASLTISRRLAKQAHIRTGRGATVVIGRGTLSGIKVGTTKLHLRLSRAMAAKLRHLRHVTLSVRIVLIAAGHNRIAVDAAGRY